MYVIRGFYKHASLAWKGCTYSIVLWWLNFFSWTSSGHSAKFSGKCVALLFPLHGLQGELRLLVLECTQLQASAFKQTKIAFVLWLQDLDSQKVYGPRTLQSAHQALGGIYFAYHVTAQTKASLTGPVRKGTCFNCMHTFLNWDTTLEWTITIMTNVDWFFFFFFLQC
jgi:hypothetical protein